MSIQCTKKVKWFERSQLGSQCKMRSNGLERESIRNKMIKLGEMVLKRLNWVQNAKTRSNGLERSQLGSQ